MSLARARRTAMLLPLALSLFVAQPALAGAVATPALQAQLVSMSTGQVQSFYANNATTLWIDADGTLDPAAEELVQLIETADTDGLSPQALRAPQLNAAVTEARFSPTPAALANAEVMLSQAFAAYVAALRNEGGTAMQYEAGTLKPQRAIDYYTLMEASKASTLTSYIR
jgi:hypothetical protein